MATKKAAKMKKVMHEFKAGTLKSGSSSGPVVKKRKQAIAIGLNQARKAMGGPLGIEQLSNDTLKEMGVTHSQLAEFWKAEDLGGALRKVMAELTEQYMGEIMNGDPHAYRAVRAMSELAKLLGDQELYVRAIRIEFERRFRNGGG